MHGLLYVCDCKYIGYVCIPVRFHTGIILVGIVNTHDAMRCIYLFTNNEYLKQKNQGTL